MRVVCWFQVNGKGLAGHWQLKRAIGVHAAKCAAEATNAGLMISTRYDNWLLAEGEQGQCLHLLLNMHADSARCQPLMPRGCTWVPEAHLVMD